jgi:hypothetical protein
MKRGVAFVREWVSAKFIPVDRIFSSILSFYFSVVVLTLGPTCEAFKAVTNATP